MQRKSVKGRSRPSWDQYFIDIAKLVATRSTCHRREVGAIIVKNKRILATGYNGAPSGLKHCLETNCLRDKLKIPSGQRQELCRAIHAEQNAILQAVVHHVDIKDSIVYATNQPCISCAKMLINAGVKEIVMADSYPDPLARKMFKEAGITVRRLT